MKAQQSTKFEASWSLWTRPLWYFGSVSRKTSWDSEMSKCKTVRKKKMSETIYFHSSLKMTPSVIQYQNHFTHQRSMKSFSAGMAATDISLWSVHTELHHSWSRASRADFDHEILLVTQKNSSIKLSWWFCTAEKRRCVYFDRFISSEIKLRI